MSTTAIVLLILFIILAIAAALLDYYIRRRRDLRSQTAITHSIIAAATLHHSHYLRRQSSPAPPSTGLLLLPRFKFSDITRAGSVTVAGDCAICLEEFSPEHHLRLLPLCLHAFHVDCIDTWLAGDSQICPVCRAEIFRSDSNLLRSIPAAGSFHVAIGNASHDRRQEITADSSPRIHSIYGGEFEYVVEEEWELQLRDAVLEEDEIVAVVTELPSPSSTASILDCESSCGMVYTGTSSRWTELSAGLEMITRWLSG